MLEAVHHVLFVLHAAADYCSVTACPEQLRVGLDHIGSKSVRCALHQHYHTGQHIVDGSSFCVTFSVVLT